MVYIIGLIPIMSSFLQHKLDIFKVITLTTLKTLRFLPYFILLLGKNYLCYMFFSCSKVKFALVLI